MTEYTLSLDSFNRPKVYTGVDAAAISILRLLRLIPGKNKNHPRMGIGLVERYRFCDEDKIQDIIDEVKTQMSIYLPDLALADIDIKYVDGRLAIGIQIDQQIYIFAADFEKSELSLNDISSAT